MKKKFLALVMTLSMALSLVPMTALAAGDQPTEEPTQGTQADVQVGQKEEPTVSVAEKEPTQDEQKTETQETSASEFTVDGLTYKVTENKDSVNVIHWDDSNKNVIIPAEVSDSENNTYSVEGISASSGFQESELESIEIQAPIEALEDSTFLKCQSLATVKLPSSIKKIGSNAFQKCGNITKLEGIDWSKVEVVEKHAFDSAFLGTADPIVFNEESFKSIQELGASAFKNAKNLTGKIVIPEGIETINNDVFNGTGIEQLVLPNSLQKIGDRAFAFCRQLEKIQIGENKSSQLNYIGLAAFANDTSVQEFVIETSSEDVKTCPAGSFQNGATQPTYTVTPPIGSNIEEGSEITLQQAVDQAEDGAVITIKKGILLDRPITITKKNVTITDGGKNFTVMTETSYDGPIFKVGEEASLTLDGNIEYNCSRIDSCFAKVQGNLILNSSTISGIKDGTAQNTGVIDVDGGLFTMKGGTISEIIGSGVGYGAVYVQNGGTFRMNGGEISDCKVRNQYSGAVVLAKGTMTMDKGEIDGNTAINFNSAGGVLVNNDSTFTMTGGTISNNSANRGGGVLVRENGQFTMTDGTISGNTARVQYSGIDKPNAGGGGVFVEDKASFTMSGGTITANTTNGMGGGVATAVLNESDTTGGGRFSMTGGTISENTASCGGGVYSWSGKDRVVLERGNIVGNTAYRQGGGVYVSHDPWAITIQNALVTKNTATIQGGGIWACPKGTVDLGTDIAIFENRAGESADDAAFLLKWNKTYSTSFTNQLYGGGIVTWYRDTSISHGDANYGLFAGSRFDASDPGNPVGLVSRDIEGYGLKAVVSEESKALAETAPLKITGNHAQRGGGIGTNGEVIVPGELSGKTSVTVHKVWSGNNGNDPSTVKVNLVRTKDDKSQTIATVILSEKSKDKEDTPEEKGKTWSYIFSNLDDSYTYTVTEDEVPGYRTSITKDTEGNNLTFTITNTRKGGGSSGGGGTVTIPDDVPTGLDLKNHYGYIIGYPVDYYTGKPTTDQTKKPVRPEGKITRAEVATIYFRMLTDENRAANWNQVSGFSDVKSSAWYNNAISTLTKAGILKGYEDGTFQPNGYITRAEFATIAIRFFSGVYEGEDLFPDIKGHWAEDYINNAANKGLVKGYEDGTFGPDRYITRAEAVTLVNRTLNRHPHNDGLHQDMLRWPDNMDTSKWYYADMQEATNSHEPDKNKTTADKEYWGKMLPIRDWEALEKEWSNANSAPGEGEVV